MDRLDLELYADRLARNADRLADDISAARLREAFAELDALARAALGPIDSAVLEAVGAIGTVCEDQSALIERRVHQLALIARIQVLVEGRLAVTAR